VTKQFNSGSLIQAVFEPTKDKYIQLIKLKIIVYILQ